MTSNLKVSRKDESFFGKRDASARATHLKAAIGKVSMTTIERKIMSNKTSFKRIALVAVSALGFGLISAVPSQSAVLNLVVTPSAGAADTTSINDSTTAATLAVRFYAETAASDTMSVSFALDSVPSTATIAGSRFALGLVDTAGATSDTKVYAGGTTAGVMKRYNAPDMAATDSVVALSVTETVTAASNGTYGAFKLGLWYTGGSDGYPKAGTYTITYIVKTFGNGVATATSTGSLTYVVTAAASDATTANSANSTSYISQGSTAQCGATADSSVSVLATASDTARATLCVTLKNAAGTASKVKESVTVTTNLGTVAYSDGTNRGRSVVLKYDAAANLTVNLYSDGTAGTATINVSTPSVTFPADYAVFYSSTVSKIVGTQRAKVITTGANSSAITAVATDVNGNVNGSSSAVYVFSDATTVVSESYTACSFSAALNYHSCSLTGVAAGTAKITIGNADKSIVSDVFTVVVTPTGVVPASVSVAFDKASYAPNEKGYVIITLKDAAGSAVAASSLANVFATGGITTTSNLASAPSTSIVDSLAATTVTTAWKTASSGYVSQDPIALIPFFAPATGGTITLSATGGTGLAAAGRVAVTATATVTDNAATALAAVTALASQVSAFITKINAQITTLTDLVMKIQKKVKA